MKKSLIKEIGSTALVGIAPVPGLGLLLSKSVRRRVRKLSGLALLGAGVAVTVPIALYVICKTSPGTQVQKN